MIFLTILLVIVMIVVLIFVAVEFYGIAQEKGYNSIKYFWWTFLFFPAGALMVIALPNKKICNQLDRIISGRSKGDDSISVTKNNANAESGTKRAREYVECPNCGEESSSEELFCWSCGMKLSTPTTSKPTDNDDSNESTAKNTTTLKPADNINNNVSTTKIVNTNKIKKYIKCPNCGEESSSTELFCWSCGMKLSTPTTSKPTDNDDSNESTAKNTTTLKPADNDDSNESTAKNTTTLKPADNINNNVSTTKIVNTNKIKKYIKCPNCGEESSSEELFCWSCGMKLKK